MNTRYSILDTRCSEQRTEDREHLSVIHHLSSVFRSGFVLPLVLVVMTILIILAIGAMMTSYGSRLQAVKTKAQTEAMLAAEAGYESALFWMCQQTDILGAIQSGGGTGNIDFGTSHCSYEVQFQNFIGARPVFHVISTGVSGRPTFTRVVDVAVMQETSGWAMGACRVPYTATTTGAVNFKSKEVIDMPLHINKAADSPDVKDIFIDMSGSPDPRFLEKVEMGEPRKSGATDKYTSPDNVMPCFEGGIYFDQPNVRITDSSAVLSKISRFRDSTAISPVSYRFTPADPCSGLSGTNKCSAVQLEFFVDGGIGKVRITNNCTVRLCTLRSSDDRTWDYNTPGAGTNPFKKYNIYAYHYRPTDANQLTIPIENTYVSQTFGGYTSDPGGQIYVNGNVVIGGDSNTGADPNQVVKGKITVVASGNIWVADSIRVDGDHEYTRDPNGIPTEDNPNVLGLIAQGVIKVIDPGISKYGLISSQGYPEVPATISGLTYQPVGIKKNPADANNDRYLLNSTIIEAAITVGGGGWGAENVARSSYGGRKEFNSGTMDNLIVHGSITEVVRGVVGMPPNDGYNKNYYIDTRLMSGILPGDIWFSGKYIPAPAGWHDRSINN